MKHPLSNTTLYLRGIPKNLVRELKARAAHQGMTLTALAIAALTRALGTAPQDDLKPLEADMDWYKTHKRQLHRRYSGEYLAIVDRRLLDHDPDFSALAARVFAKMGVRPVFMPQCADTDHIVHLRSPRLVRVQMPRYPYETRYTPPAAVLPVRVGRPGAVPTVFLPALVDTGADISVLPQGLPARLGLPVVDRVVVAGVDRLAHPLPVYAAEVALNGYRTVIRAVSLGATPLIGRDFLNRITVHLQGPEAILDVDLPVPSVKGKKRHEQP